MAFFAFLIIHWYLSLFFQSVFHHRYSAHGQFTMSRAMEKFFFIGCFITQGSSYISARTYGIMHRLHHAHTDKPEDPHSPSNSPTALSMMLETRNNYHAIYMGRTEVPEKYLKNLPDWPAFEKLVHNWYARLLWWGIYFAIYWFLATQWWMWLFFPITVGIGAVQGVFVNWVAHVVGYRNYDRDDTSKNILPVDLIFWGEAHHNNHHHNPHRANNAHKWYEFDSGYWTLRGLDKLGLIKMKS